MKVVTELLRGRRAMLSVLRLWLIFLACAGAAAFQIAALQYVQDAVSPSPVLAVGATPGPEGGVPARR